MSYKLTEQQQKRLAALEENNTTQQVHTAKWVLVFADGKEANYLTEYCHDAASAFRAGCERFTARLVDIKQ